MKRLSKVFVLLFVILCIPMLMSCGENSDSDNKIKNNKITFDLNSEYGKLNTPVLVKDMYKIDLDGIEIAKIDSHGTNILGNIKENTIVGLSIYISINSYDVEIKLNDEVVEYTTSERENYQILNISFVINSNINIYMNGSLEALV